MRRSIIHCYLALFIFGAIALPDHAYADLMQDAVMDYQFQDFKEAENKFRQILVEDPDNISAHYYMGMVLQQNGKVKEAVPHLELVMEKSKTTPVEGIANALASAYIAADMAEKAVPIYKKKYEENKQDDAIAFTYAKALESAGDAHAARVIYLSLIEKKGPYADAARFQMAQIILANKAYATAIEQLDEIDETSAYGPAAKSYKDALAPAVKPFNLYISSEYFNNDNASSGGSRINKSSPVVASDGLTQIVSLSTRAFELSEKLRAKLGYLYYGIFYTASGAKSSNFVGHFINPSLAIQATPNINIELKGDVQFFYFAQQKLSENLGGTLTASWASDVGDSVALHGSFMSKKYTTSFFSKDATTGTTSISSLNYLDATSTGVGLAGTITEKNTKGSLTVDYTFNMERPSHINSADATLAAKASDSKFNEHSIRINATLPIGGPLSKLSLLGNTSYSYKDYLNKQDAAGLVYSTAANKYVKAASLVYGANLQVSDIIKIWGYGITLSAGFESTRSHSTASALTYDSNKYMGAISAVF